MLNLGAIQFSLGINFQGLDSANQRMQAFGRSVQGMQTAANRGFNTTITQMRRQENAVLSALEKVKRFTDQVNNSSLSPQVKLDQINAAHAAFDTLTKRVEGTRKAIDSTKFDRSIAGFNSAFNDLSRTFASAERTSQAAGRQSASAERGFIRQQNAIERTAEQVRNLNAAIERSGRLTQSQTTGLTDRLDSAFNNFRGQLTPNMNPRQFNDAANSMRRAIGDVRRDFANMQSTFDKAPEGWEAWRRGLRGIGDASLLVSGHLGGLSTRMFALGQIVREYGVGIGIAAGGMVALGVAINGVSSKVIDTTIQIQKAEKALTAITRSSAAAGVEIDFVRNVANNSGQVFTSLTDTYSRFLASANSSGQILNETHRQFATVSQAAGILGLSVEDTQGVFRAMEQMLSKGTVQAEELRGQLGDRLPGAFAIGAQAMGVTTQKLGDLMKKGQVLSADFLPKFTSQLAKVFNVDITKPVEGIVAAQNRLKNAMDQFYLSVDKSSGVTKIYQVVLEGFTITMVALTNNMQTVAQVVGALAGAFVGLGIAMMVPAAFALFGAMAGWIGTVISLARTITSLAEAVALFNAALMLTPAGWINLLVKIAAVAAGAAGGMWLMEQAQTALQGKMADTSGIEEYIKGQNLALTATEATTRALMDQIRVMTNKAASDGAAKSREAAEALRGGISWSDTANAGVYGVPKALGGQGVRVVTAAQNFQKRTGELVAQANAATAETRRLQGLAAQLGGIADRQHGMTGTPMQLTQKTEKPKKVSDNINRTEDVIAEAQKYAEMIQMLAKGPQELALVDDLYKARDLLRDMNEKQLARTDAALKAAGFTAGTMEQRLAAAVTQARKGKEEVEAFTRAWERIDRANIERTNVSRQLSFLSGGGDARQLYKLDALADAEDMLRKIKTPEALDAIRTKLKALGFEGNSAAEALAKFFASADEGRNTIQIMSRLQEAMRGAVAESASLNAQLAGYRRGAGLGEAVARYDAINRKVEDFRQQLIASGDSAEVAAGKVAEFRDVLIANDRASEALDRVRKRAERTRDMWRESFSDMKKSMVDVITQSKNLGDAMTSLWESLRDRFLENSLDNLFDGIEQFISGKTKGTDSKAAGLLASTSAQTANTAALTTLTATAYATANALTAIIAASGGDAGAGGGGILGSLFKLGGSLFGGGSNFDGVDTSDWGSGIWDEKAPWMPETFDWGSMLNGARASGGPATGGLRYRVNEPGVGVEIFEPGQSGTITPLAKMLKGGAGGGNYIDARTTIDARGATPDAVAALEEKMNARDRQLRASLPSMVDNRIMENKWRGRS